MVIIAIGALLTGVALAVGLSTPTANVGVVALDAANVAAPFVVAAVVWRRTPAERFAVPLVVLGVTFFLVALSASDSQLAYSIGRIASYAVVPLLLYVLLAFPSGVLESGPTRAIVLAAALVAIVLFVLMVPFTRTFPVPFPWASCGGDCPANAFFSGARPAIVGPVQHIREILVAALFGASVVVMVSRMKRATPLRRRMLMAVLTTASLWFISVVGVFVGRRAGLPGVEHAADWGVLGAAPLIAVALLVDSLKQQAYAGSALARLVQTVAAYPSPAELRDAMADALSDPSVELYYWVPAAGGYADADGKPVDIVVDGATQTLTPVTSQDGPVAGIIHDRALAAQPDLVQAVASAAQIILDHQRLQLDLRASVRRVRASQARMLAAADNERERIERDLHDGAQQQLVALRMKLELLADVTPSHNARAKELQSRIADDVEAALEEIRDLARGIYPPLLASHGLGDALEAVALRAAVPTSVTVATDRRFPRAVETAVYFCCREALQNVAKHAPSARRAWIDVACDDSTLRFAVRDDGDGFDVAVVPEGMGLLNMRDRLSVTGGDLVVRSRPEAGTEVEGVIPLGPPSSDPWLPAMPAGGGRG